MSPDLAKRLALVFPTVVIKKRALRAGRAFNASAPLLLAESDWRRAIDDAGRFLDAWGAHAAAMRWGAGELFDMPRGGRRGGLVWQLKGQRVEALGDDRAPAGSLGSALSAARGFG
jgi:hypothetical protein